MSSLAARNAADTFLIWMSGGQSQFSSYEEAHLQWLVQADGLNVVDCDYTTAAEAVMEIVSRLDSQDYLLEMPLVLDPDRTSWKHMTMTGFQELVKGWQQKELQESDFLALLGN